MGHFEKVKFCTYCKERIMNGEKWEKDEIGNKYHKECWKLLKEDEEDIYL